MKNSIKNLNMKTPKNLTIREIEKSEYSQVKDFTYHSLYVPPGEEPFTREVLDMPHVKVYFDEFGVATGDIGVVVENDGKIIALAWTRIMPLTDNANADKEAPVLGIAVLENYRGQGIGTLLMEKLFELLRQKGYKKTSLSVHVDNPAFNLYKRLGYKITGQQYKEIYMIKELYG